MRVPILTGTGEDALHIDANIAAAIHRPREVENALLRSRGCRSPQGIQGATGAQGPQGVPGPQGPKGDTGGGGISGYEVVTANDTIGSAFENGKVVNVTCP